jgi:hypothetical protein
MMRRCPSVLAALLVAASACAGTGLHELVARVPAGTWGGQGAVMVATDSGASFTFNCASGSVDGPLTVASDGAFTWAGTYARVSPLPGSPHDPPHAATYHGTASATHVTVALTVPDIPLESDSVTLTFGDNGNLALCP